MDWLTFLSNVVSALAWPYVALILIKELRGHLPAIGRAIRIAKYKGVEVEFNAAVQTVVAETRIFFPKLESEFGVDGSTDTDVVRKLDELAKTSGVVAMREAWSRVDIVEKKLWKVIRRPTFYPWTFISTEDHFVEENVLTKRQALVYEEMRALPGAAERKKGGEIDAESVKQYIRSTVALEAHLESVLKARQQVLGV